MQRAAFTFALVTVVTACLAALCLFLVQKGYPFGAVGLGRLDSTAKATTFVPLAAIYFLSAALLMLLPLRAASFVLTHAAEVVFWTVVTLLAAIVGVVAARFAWGQSNAPQSLLDWRFFYAAAVIGSNFALNNLRSNILLRSLFFAVFVAGAAFCLFWSR